MISKRAPFDLLTLLLSCASPKKNSKCHFKNPVVPTKYGNVLGSVELSRKGKAFHSFRGIPYAKAPIGNLRFKINQKN